eukprot:1147322-Pelagomonas_calceolata.AAC.15
MFAEMWVEQIAKVVGKPDHEVRQLNMYKEGDITHFGQAMEHCRVGPCWEQAMRNSQYETRRAQTAESVLSCSWEQAKRSSQCLTRLAQVMRVHMHCNRICEGR